MFEIFSKYLFEHQKLIIPHIGSFALNVVQADANFANETLAPPSWKIHFSETIDAADDIQKDRFCKWLSANKAISYKEADGVLNAFISELETQLASGEAIHWQGVGHLQKKNGIVVFSAEAATISPFTSVSAKKITRPQSHYTKLVGNEEVDVVPVFEEHLVENGRKEKSVMMWILLGVSLVALGWYLVQKGCNKIAISNTQKVESTAYPSTTYTVE